MNTINEVPVNRVPTTDIKKKLKKCYNRGSLSLILQLAIATTISAVISIVYTMIYTISFVASTETTDMDMIMQAALSASADPTFLLTVNAISFLIANIVSYFIGNATIKKLYTAQIFGKIQLKPFDCFLSVLAVLGIQMVSVIVQSIIMSITGMSGVSDEINSMMSFSGNMFHNFVLVLYTVVIAAVTEELLFRGIAMKALSPVSKTFALVASSMLFGFMHGNFNQIFNGFLLGMVIGYAAIKSRSIFLPIILHMCANGHAMLLSFFEYKFGEKMLAFENIYIFVVAILGIGAAVLLFIRNGKPNDKTDGYSDTNNIEGIEKLESNKGFTWSLLLKTPCFWIFTVYCFFTAILSLTPLA